MGSKATHQLLILALLKFFYLFNAQSVCGKKPKTFKIRGQMITKWIFGSVPKSPTQMGSLSVKKASEKFSRLGTFKQRPVTYFLIIAAPFAI
jgi:hypothetical protein